MVYKLNKNGSQGKQSNRRLIKEISKCNKTIRKPKKSSNKKSSLYEINIWRLQKTNETISTLIKKYKKELKINGLKKINIYNDKNVFF